MIVLCLLFFAVTVSGFFSPYTRENDIEGKKDDGSPLILTPYIEAGKIDEAKSLALVNSFKGTVRSYSGYVTVDKKCDSNMFFWFFPTKNNKPDTPIVVWLQGGPGASSLYGLFAENGPYELKPDNKLKLRKYSWTHVASVLYIDNPVGTGYSYTKSENCYSKNEVEVGRNLLVAVKQILKLFPEYSTNPFYVTGESYGGKYVPALSYAIHKDKDNKINFKGLAIGNGLVDPENQLIYSDYLYQLGLIDTHVRDIFRKEEERCRQLIAQKNWKEAWSCFDTLLDGDVSKTTHFKNATGFEFYFNFLHATPPPEGNLTEFLTRSSIRKSIHVGNATWHSTNLVEMQLMEDICQSVRPWLEELLEHYDVLIYNGQLDIIVAYPLTLGYLQKLNWSEANTYKTAGRKIWRVDQKVAGYSKTAGRLTEVLVRDAGHMVPLDQPKWAMDLIMRFLTGKPFY